MALPIMDLPTYELEVPSTKKKIKFRPFLVKEEKILLIALESNDERNIRDAVHNLLKNCILKGYKGKNIAKNINQINLGKNGRGM